MKNTRYFTEKVSAWERQTKKKKKNSSQPVCGKKVDYSGFVKGSYKKNDVSDAMIFHSDFSSRAFKPFPSVRTEQELTPNPAE